MRSPRRRNWRTLLRAVSCATLALGCSETGEASGSEPLLERLSDVVDLRAELRLDETVGVINVNPRVAVDPDGGFLVADPKEAQVRRYSAEGRLLGVAGRKGQGPGEFDRIAAALRLSSGGIAALDMHGRITILNREGRMVVETQTTPLAPIYTATALDGDRLLVTGRLRGHPSSPLVHVWDVPSGRLVRSFFEPHHSPAFTATHAFAGTADAKVKGDTVAVLFALSDSVYLHNLDDGRHIRTIPAHLRHYRALRKPMPLGDDEREVQEWLGSFTSMSRLFWDNDGFLLVSYDMAGPEPQFRLARIGMDGKRTFEVMDAPKLLTTSDDGSLVFVKPGSETQNFWSIGQLVR